MVGWIRLSFGENLINIDVQAVIIQFATASSLSPFISTTFTFKKKREQLNHTVVMFSESQFVF